MYRSEIKMKLKDEQEDKEDEMKTINLKAKYSRRFPDPINKEDQESMENIEHHVFLCRAIDMPLEIPTEPNPRAQRTDKTIYKSGENIPINSYVENLGITSKNILLNIKKNDTSIYTNSYTLEPGENRTDYTSTVSNATFSLIGSIG